MRATFLLILGLSCTGTGYKIGQLSGIHLNVIDGNNSSDFSISSSRSNSSSNTAKSLRDQIKKYSCTKENRRDCCEATWTCHRHDKSQIWTVEKIQFQPEPAHRGFIKKGSYGQVWAVERNGGAEKAALKWPTPLKDTESCLDIVQEIQKIAQINEDMARVEARYPVCRARVMAAIDTTPCMPSGHTIVPMPVAASYAMERMDGDLDKHANKFPAGCHRDIALKAMIAIRCLHLAGWVHSDVKEKNFLWKGEDARSCPEEVRLADYGITQRTGTTRDVFNDYYNWQGSHFWAWYLVSDVFRKPSTQSLSRLHSPRDADKVWTLNLQRPPLKHGGKVQYEFQQEIDWCSYEYYFPGNPNPYWSGNCGVMGPGRKKHVVVTGLSSDVTPTQLHRRSRLLVEAINLSEERIKAAEAEELAQRTGAEVEELAAPLSELAPPLREELAKDSKSRPEPTEAATPKPGCGIEGCSVM